MEEQNVSIGFLTFSVIDMSTGHDSKTLMCQHKENHLFHYCVDLFMLQIQSRLTPSIYLSVWFSQQGEYLFDSTYTYHRSIVPKSYQLSNA